MADRRRVDLSLEELEAGGTPSLPPSAVDEEDTASRVESDDGEIEIDQVAVATDQVSEQASLSAEAKPSPLLQQVVRQAAEPMAPRLQAALTEEIEHETDRKRLAAWQHERGHLLERYLQQESASARAYAEALSLDPALRPNLWAIRRTLVGHGRWEKLLKLCDAELRIEQDPQRRAEVLLEKGWMLQDRFGQAEQAASCLWQAHELTRGGWYVPLLALERIAAEKQDHELLARVYAAMAQTVADPERRAAALRELARLQELTQQDDGASALATLDQAAELSLDRTPVLVQMEAMTVRQGRESARVAVLSALAREIAEGEDSDPREAAALLLEAAWIARSSLQDPEHAQRMLQDAIELCPDERVLQLELELLAETQQDSPLLLDLLTQRLQRSESREEQTGLWFRLALVHLRQQDTVSAARALESCLERTPGYLPALVELERAAFAAPDPQKLIDIWLAELAQSGEGQPHDASHRARILWRVAMVQLHALDGADEASRLCQEALSIDPACAPARELRVELLLRRGEYETLADLWLHEASEREGDQASRLWEKVAALALGPLRDADRALNALRELWQRGDATPYTLYRFAELLDHEERFAELDEVLAELQRRESTDSQRVAVGLRRAHVAERHEGTDRAAEVYREVLQIEPDNAYALAALQTVLRHGADYPALARLLSDAAEQCGDSGRRRDLLLELGSLCLGPLNAPDRAIDVYTSLAEQDSADLHLQHRLELSASRAGQRDVQLKALRAQAAASAEPSVRARLLLQIADLLEEQGAPLEEVSRAYDDALELADEATRVQHLALWGMARQHVHAQRWPEARAAYGKLSEAVPPPLRGYLLEEQAWLAGCSEDASAADELWARALAGSASVRPIFMRLLAACMTGNAALVAESCGWLAETLGDSPLGAALQLQRGALSLQGDVDDPGVTRALFTVLEHDPGNLEAIVALLGFAEPSAQQAADLIVRLSQHISSKHEEQIPLLLARAQQAAGHPAAAAHALSSLLDREPNNLPALLVLQRTAATAGVGEIEGRAWLRIAMLLREPEARGMAYGRAGALFEALAQPQLAACAYRRALAAKPNDEDLMARLEEAYRDSHDHAGLEELVGLRLGRAEEPSRMVSLLFARAELRHEHLDDPRGAACDLLRVLRFDPNNEVALERLAALCDEHGDLQRAELYYRRLLEMSHTPDVQRRTVLQLADVFARQRRLEKAATTCRRYLESYPQQEEVWERLVAIYLDSSEPRHALGALKRLSELPASPEVRAARLRRLAGFHWHQLGDLRQARDALILALEADATDLEVLEDLRRVCRELGVEQDFRQPVERAKAEIRQGIGRAPLDVEQYERLLRLAEWSEDQHTLLGSLGVLCCLNAAQPAEQQLYRRRMDVAVFEPQRQLPSHAWYDSLVTREARGALGEIWRVVAEAVPKMFPNHAPSDLAALGVGRDDRISLETGGPILRLAQALNIGEFELYVTRQDGRVVHGIVADPPQLVVSYRLLSSRAPADRFVLGRALYLLRDGAMAVEALSPAELQLLLAGAVYAVEPSALKGEASPDLGESAKQLQRVLSRRARRALPLAVNRLLQEGGGFDVEGWANGVLMSANRAAFLVCGNIVVAMQQLVQELGDPTQRGTQDNLEILRKHALAAQLLPFSVSTQYLELRQALRI